MTLSVAVGAVVLGSWLALSAAALGSAIVSSRRRTTARTATRHARHIRQWTSSDRARLRRAEADQLATEIYDYLERQP